MTELYQDVVVAGTRFAVDAAVTGAPVRLTTQVRPEEEAGGHVLTVRLAADDGAPFTLERLRLRFSVPATDMHGVYLGGDPGLELGYLPHAAIVRQTSAHRGVPFLAFMHRNGENRRAVGLLDQLVESSWHAQLSELTAAYDVTLTRPAVPEEPDGDARRADAAPPGTPVGLHVPGGVWQDELFVSDAHDPWIDVIGRYTALARARAALPDLPVPEHAWDPVFCTWTAVHHDVSHDWVLRTARLAAELGFGTWITDDGWQVDGGRFGRYDEVGVWQPSHRKFPDLAAHVAAVQALGLRYVLWVAPFMVGEGSALAAELHGRLLPGDEKARFRMLDPLEPGTARHVRDLLTRLVRDHGLDGLKVDFVDAVPSDLRRAHRSLGRAMAGILADALRPLAQERPGLLVEFRNRYANLASRAYANLYRSSDLPVNPFQNRWQATMLRVLVPDAAVVTDPMLWHPDDTDENVAVHLINGIAAVPMVSVDLTRYPESHRRLVAHWMGFYREHRGALAHGRFRPVCRGTTIPRTDFVGEEEVVHGLYDDVAVPLGPGPRRRWVLNASTRPWVALEPAEPGAGTPSAQPGGTVTTRDAVGRVLAKEAYGTLPPRLDVPVGGYLEIELEEAGSEALASLLP